MSKGVNQSIGYMQDVAGYTRHSVPHKPMSLSHTMINYTPSTNYTIPSSDGKNSIHYGQMPHSMAMHGFASIPFQKVHSSSHETFATVDNAHYGMHMPQEMMGGHSHILNNTAPLPDMATFNRGVSQSPDFNMQSYYNVNMASTGCISNNSGYMNMQPQIQYYNEGMGSTWPRIPQMAAVEVPGKYSTIPREQTYNNKKGLL